MRAHSKWFKGISAKDKEQKEKELRSYRNAFEALAELLQEEFEEATPDYDCPSWSHKQADQNGANRKLRAILSLIKIED